MLRRRILLILILGLFALPTQAQLFIFASPTIANVPYNSENPHPRHVLDIYLPENENDEMLPTLFLIHGGGYVFGNKRSVGGFAQRFADLGYAVVTPSYRLAPADPYPAPIEDLFCALAWTHANADQYNFDMTRLAIVGESAGANAAAMLTAIDDPASFLTDCPYHLPENHTVRGVVAYYIYSDLSTCDCKEAKLASSMYLSVAPGDFESDSLAVVWGEASPLVWLDGDEPPFLLLHGVNDEIIEVSETLHFAEALTRWNIPHEMLLVDARQHAFIADFGDPAATEAADTVAAFLDDVMN